MNKQYMLAEQTIGGDDLHDLIGWLQTNPWLTHGPLVREFEQAWARWLGVKHATYVNSGSSANLLMYYAPLVAGRLRNTRVIVPAVSWVTTVAPAIQLGFEPIMCEADPQTFGVDLNHVERLLRAHEPAAVIIVHVLGVPNDMGGLTDLQRRYDFLLMEDSCAAMGSRYRNQLVGTFGALSTFSFFYGHHLSTIEGGMVCTNDDQLHDVLLHLRSHGWAKDVEPAKEQQLARDAGALEFNRPFTFYYPGFNVRSSDLNARIGLSQLRKIDHLLARRIENHRQYQRRFQEAGLHCQRNDDAIISSISFCGLAASQPHRDAIAQVLRKNRIETRPIGGGNMSRQPFWYRRYGTTEFPVADQIHTLGFQLPNHPHLSLADVDFICDTVLAVEP
jgi:CDP-6-deoxy-D-xylo-4-hexulose-3-dehydrase